MADMFLSVLQVGADTTVELALQPCIPVLLLSSLQVSQPDKAKQLAQLAQAQALMPTKAKAKPQVVSMAQQAQRAPAGHAMLPRLPFQPPVQPLVRVPRGKALMVAALNKLQHSTSRRIMVLLTTSMQFLWRVDTTQYLWCLDMESEAVPLLHGTSHLYIAEIENEK